MPYPGFIYILAFRHRCSFRGNRNHISFLVLTSARAFWELLLWGPYPTWPVYISCSHHKHFCLVNSVDTVTSLKSNFLALSRSSGKDSGFLRPPSIQTGARNSQATQIWPIDYRVQGFHYTLSVDSLLQRLNSGKSHIERYSFTIEKR